VSKNQLRSLYGHLRALTAVDDESVLQTELKLFLARMMYKCARQQAKLDENVYKYFKEELKIGNISRDEYRSVFIKYFEGVVAYSYAYLKQN